MNPPTTTALRAETQLETTPIQPIPLLPYNEIIGTNLDTLEDTLPELLSGHQVEDFHLVKDYGRVVAKHPVAPVSASIGRQGQIQELALDPNELSISRYRTELTVMRKQPILIPEDFSSQMKAPYEVIDFGEFYQTAGSIVVQNVINSFLRYNGPRQQRHETQIC